MEATYLGSNSATTAHALGCLVCMGYHQRIECREVPSFQTTRARNSELWFVNNQELEHVILGYAARYSTRYEVKLYALAIEGNHIQNPAHFPKGNRAHFMALVHRRLNPPPLRNRPLASTALNYGESEGSRLLQTLAAH